MPLKLEDGYTLSGRTTGNGNYGEPQPVVCFEYRPPTPRELSAFRYALSTAASGEGQHDTRVAYLLKRLVSWDVLGLDDKPTPITSAALDRVPDPILQDLVNESSKWRPKGTPEENRQAAEQARGN